MVSCILFVLVVLVRAERSDVSTDLERLTDIEKRGLFAFFE